MTNHDRETTVVTNSGGGAGWFVAILLLIALAAGAFYVYGGFADSNDINVKIEVPDAPKE